MVTLQERKAFGSFYTPKLLANLLASTIISLSKKINREICTVVDPATGDSSLLSSFYDYASNIGIKTRYVGVDIDECAIEKSKELFASKNIDAVFLKKDAIYPYASMSSISGWNELKKISANQNVLRADDDIHLIDSDKPKEKRRQKYYLSRQYDNRLFDRDTFLLAHYDVNFLFVVSLYGRNNSSSKAAWRNRVRQMFRKEISPV